jgi:hypothetical protein
MTSEKLFVDVGEDFEVGDPVYMASAEKTEWFAGKVYKAVVISKNGNNLHIIFEDGSSMNVTQKELQNFDLNISPPIRKLNQQKLFHAFTEQKNKQYDKDSFIKNLFVADEMINAATTLTNMKRAWVDMTRTWSLANT